MLGTLVDLFFDFCAWVAGLRPRTARFLLGLGRTRK